MSYAVMPLSDWQNILDSVKAKTGKSDTLVSGSVADEIDSISGDGDTIPQYVFEEAEATIAKANSHRNLGRTIRFIAISDTHEDSELTYTKNDYGEKIVTANKHAGQAIKYIADRLSLDFIAHLGDASSAGSFLSTYYFRTLCKDIKQISKQVFSSNKGTKHIFVAGNHDQFYCTDGKRLFNSGAYILFGSECDGITELEGGYGYLDIDEAKVRVIYLNTSDIPSATTAGTYIGVTQTQQNWLCETLIDTNTKTDAHEWNILILSHVPLDYGNAASVSTKVLIPYVNGESCDSYSFSGKNSAKIISNVHGHVHCYVYWYLADRIRRFAIPNACFVGANHYGKRTDAQYYLDNGWAEYTTYDKTANSGKDTAFSLVTIDLDNGQCYVDNYGAGIDRVFDTDYKPIVIPIPVSITNISYSGDTTVGTAIDTSKFTFTVTYDNGSTKTKTQVASVSPAKISVVGNNTVTITYTENGTSITGTVNIVGIAEIVKPTSISGITYSGDTTVGATLDNSKFSFTVHYSNGTTANKTSATSISPSTIGVVGNNTITVNYTEDGTTVSGTATVVGTEAPVANLLNLDREYVSGTASETMALDEHKAYLNVNNLGVFNARSCAVSNVTENSVTVTESGIGGIRVAYYVDLTNVTADSLRMTFDYSGAGKCRTYYQRITDQLLQGQDLYINATSGASGTADVTFSIWNCKGIVIHFSSNTGQTVDYSNVSLTPVS